MQISVFSHIFLPKFKSEAEIPENLTATSNPDIRSHVRFLNFSICVEQIEMKAVSVQSLSAQITPTQWYQPLDQ